MSKRSRSLTKQATIKDVAEVIDDQPFCICLNPSLTTVRLPIAEAGKQAIHMLLDRVSGKRKDVEQATLPCPLIVRESSGAPASPGT